jgi:hypothetical protein
MGSGKWWGSDQNDKVSNFFGGAVYTPLPSFRGAVERKVGHLAARTYLFAANLDVKRQSRTVTLRQRQQRVFSPPTRCYAAQWSQQAGRPVAGRGSYD